MKTTDMPEFRVIFPKEEYKVIEFIQDDLPGIGLINVGLRMLEHKIVFSWHLSIMLELEDLIDNGMPSQNERDTIEKFENELNIIAKGKYLEKPNAFFLGKITWNETRELIWRVHNPEPINEALQRIIEKESHTRLFDYRIDPDEDWKLAKWHLKDRTIHSKTRKTNQ